MKKILVGAFILVLILVFGSTGYVFIENTNLTDAIFMTVISITTVGFKEVVPLSQAGKIFTRFTNGSNVNKHRHLVAFFKKESQQGAGGGADDDDQGVDQVTEKREA